MDKDNPNETSDTIDIGDIIEDHTADQCSDQDHDLLVYNGRFVVVEDSVGRTIERWVFDVFRNLTRAQGEDAWYYDAESTADNRRVMMKAARTQLPNGHAGRLTFNLDQHNTFYRSTDAETVYLVIIYHWITQNIIHIVDTARVAASEVDDVLNNINTTGTNAHVRWPQLSLDSQAIADREQAVQRLFVAMKGCDDQQQFFRELRGFQRLRGLIATRDCEVVADD